MNPDIWFLYVEIQFMKDILDQKFVWFVLRCEDKFVDGCVLTIDEICATVEEILRSIT